MTLIPVVSRDKASRLFSELKQARRTKPVRVSFRSIAQEIGLGERATHQLHSYPAKLLRSIPAFFLAVDELAPSGTVVLDPFCGSGTVLLESMCAGYDSIGVDVNPLATLISRVKTRRLNQSTISAQHQELLESVPRHRHGAASPDVVNLSHWSYPHVIEQLVPIEGAVAAMPPGKYRDFFRVCLSACVRNVSLANPRLSVPVRLRPDVYPPDHVLYHSLHSRLRKLKRINVWKTFSRIVEDNRTRVEKLSAIPPGATASVFTADVRKAEPTDAATLRSCALIITSPPYLGAQKYVRATSLSLNWLRLAPPSGLRHLEQMTVGREHLNRCE